MGEHNTPHQLQNYVVGPAPGGLRLTPGGALDMEQSFVRLDYFALLGDISVRNNVQAGVSSRPVDFVAVRVPPGVCPLGRPRDLSRRSFCSQAARAQLSPCAG